MMQPCFHFFYNKDLTQITRARLGSYHKSILMTPHELIIFKIGELKKRYYIRYFLITKLNPRTVYFGKYLSWT